MQTEYVLYVCDTKIIQTDKEYESERFTKYY